MSVRTVIRRLERQGTSHQQIIDDIQKARASRLLEVSGLRVRFFLFVQVERMTLLDH